MKCSLITYPGPQVRFRDFAPVVREFVYREVYEYGIILSKWPRCSIEVFNKSTDEEQSSTLCYFFLTIIHI